MVPPSKRRIRQSDADVRSPLQLCPEALHMRRCEDCLRVWRHARFEHGSSRFEAATSHAPAKSATCQLKSRKCSWSTKWSTRRWRYGRGFTPPIRTVSCQTGNLHNESDVQYVCARRRWDQLQRRNFVRHLQLVPVQIERPSSVLILTGPK